MVAFPSPAAPAPLSHTVAAVLLRAAAAAVPVVGGVASTAAAVGLWIKGFVE